MGRGIKIALPGYDAFNDTDPDHFALYVDQDDPTDYVLLKEKAKATVSVVSSTTIPHGLGYVPLCLVFAEITSGVWRKLFSRQIDGTGCWFEVDDTNLTLLNTTGSPKLFSYHIFLDNITSGNAVFPNLGTHLGFVVGKHGVNVELATDPNDFIFHSDFNTFKIIVQATKQVTLAASTNNQSFTEPHNQKFIPLMAGYAKQTTLSQVFLPNSDNVDLWGPKLGWTSTGVRFNYIAADINNIIFNFDNTNGSTRVVDIRYFVLEKVT